MVFTLIQLYSREQFISDLLNWQWGLWALIAFVGSWSALPASISVDIAKCIYVTCVRLSEKDFQRNYDIYTADLTQNNPTSTGIKGSCLLNDVGHFHVTTNYAPDVMHDLLEGVCGLEIYLVIGDLIIIWLRLLNSRITSFDYSPCDSKNKPSPVMHNKLQNPDDSPTGRTAAQ